MVAQKPWGSSMMGQWLRACMRWPVPALLAWVLGWAVYGALQVWTGFVVLALVAALAVGAALSVLARTWWRRAMLGLGFPLSWLMLNGADAAQLPAWGWLLALGALLLIYPVGAWTDAPLFPTPRGALDELAGRIVLPADALVLDAGCGTGAGLRALRSAWPHARLHGLEWSWPLALVCALRCPWARVRRGDIWAADWGAYDMVYLFQRPESMSRAAVKCLTEMRDGAWLVSLNFPIEGIAPTHELRLSDGRPLYAWRAPLQDIDRASVQAHDEAAQWAQVLPLRKAQRRRGGGRDKTNAPKPQG